MSPRCWHSRTVEFDVNTAKCTACGQRWVLDGRWQPVSRIGVSA